MSRFKARESTNLKWRFQQKLGFNPLTLLATILAVPMTSVIGSGQTSAENPLIAQKQEITTNIRFAPLVSTSYVIQKHTILYGTHIHPGIVVQDSAPVICKYDSSLLTKNEKLVKCAWTGLDFGSQTGALAKGIAHNPGKYVVECVATVLLNGYKVELPAVSSKPIFVVGGPISCGISGGRFDTPVRTHNYPEKEDSPFYLQYFGFDPAHGTPWGAQTPQNGIVFANGFQPDGTTYKWSLPKKLVPSFNNETFSGFSIGIAGADGSAGRPLRVVLTYNFKNPDLSDPVTGACTDDSDKQLSQEGKPLKLAYKFVVHKPMKLILVSTKQQVSKSSPYQCTAKFNYQLLDDGNEPMSGVNVIERWERPWGDPAKYVLEAKNENIVDTIPSPFENNPFPRKRGIPCTGIETSTSLLLKNMVLRYYAGTYDTNYVDEQAHLSGILVRKVYTSVFTDSIVCETKPLK